MQKNPNVSLWHGKKSIVDIVMSQHYLGAGIANYTILFFWTLMFSLDNTYFSALLKSHLSMV